VKAVLQRVSRAAVRVDGAVVGAIGPGLAILLGIERGDDEAKAAWLGRRVVELRLFTDGEKHFERSLLEMGYAALVVSQFTLLADVSHGRRPDFTQAERGQSAEPLVDRFCRELRSLGVTVAEGQFGAEMEVEIHNHGPVTIIVER
jgi:D-tyrosyl-tRNA(Tyr) deacylase